MEFTNYPIRPEVRTHLIINCIISSIVFITVVARFATRRYMGAGLGWDDYLIASSLPPCYALLGIQGAFSQLGSGYPITEVMVNVPVILPLAFAFQLLYILALCFVKSSILCFYRRAFSSTRLTLAVTVMFGVVAVWAISHAMTVVFICTPVSFQWDLTLEGKCGDQIKLFQSIISTNILTDVMIMLLPVYTVWQLNMRKTEKAGVMACFLIGVVCIIAAILRLVYVSTVDIRGDLTGTMPVTVFLAAFEPNLAVLCASIPMLRPRYHKFRQRVGLKHTGNISPGESDNNQAQRSNDSELDTVDMLEANVSRELGVAVSIHENNRMRDGSGSGRKTPADRT